MTTKMYRNIWRFAICLVGIALFGAGVYLYLNWIEIFTRMRGKEMALSPTSRAYAGWKVSPLPLDFDVYLFNWTNPEDFYVGSKKKPRFEQLGPYRFREKPDKVDIAWHKANYSLSFRKKAFFYFDAEHSNGTLADKITTVNTVAHAAALRTRGKSNFFQKLLINQGLNMFSQTVHETKTADEWMFSGYEHSMVSLGRTFTPDEVPFDRIGWLYTRNGSSTFDGYFNMYTGVDDLRKMGQVYAWNNQTHTGAFEGACGNVFGSMGEFFPPNLSTNDSISIFLPNLCRAVPLDYTETVSVHGVTAYKFAAGERAVDNGTLYPETKCFCVKGKCEPAGVINISPCKYNSPVYMSYPHFYKADPSYLAAIEGLQPDPAKHEFYMTLEPNAGVPMDVGGGFQMNYLMEPVEGVSLYTKVPRTFIPVMWCEERVQVTAEIASDIALVPLIVLIGQIVTGVMLASGLICFCWHPTRLVSRYWHTDDPKTKASLLKPRGARCVTRASSTTPAAQVQLLTYQRTQVPQANAAEQQQDGVTDSLLDNATTQAMSTDVIIR